MLDRVTIERALAIAGGGPLVIALSGGGDSSALMHLLVDALGASRLKPIIVDHALRAGSAADAQRARAIATSLGTEAEVVTLEWGGAPRRAQQAARNARYRLLSETARRLGAAVIMLGHTADDQAETVLMRGAARSGWRGLAGMGPIAPVPVWPEGRGLVLARPLLAVRRADLRNELRSRAATWLEDPANTNPDFERVRVRGRLASLEAAGFNPMRLVDLASALRDRATQLDQAAEGLISQSVQFDGPRITIRRGAWKGDSESRQRALGVLLMAAAGSERAPSPAALARLSVRMLEPPFRGAALAGARLSPTKQGILLQRDLGGIFGRAGGPQRIPPLVLPAGEEKVWDGRLSLCAAHPGRVVEAGDDGAPVLVCDGQRVGADAADTVHVRAEWLVKAHANHLLAVR